MAKFTLIHTNQQTTITIDAPRDRAVRLETMQGTGNATKVCDVRAGATDTASVGPGLYRIADAERVTAVPAPVSIVPLNSKDDPPEHLIHAFGKEAVKVFLSTMSHSLSAPASR